jgi:hypothetical protein
MATTVKARSADKSSDSKGGTVRSADISSRGVAPAGRNVGLIGFQQAAGNLAVQSLLRSGANDDERRATPPGRRHRQRAPAPEAFPFPHGATIQRAVGDNLALRAVLDAAGCAERQTPAFTRGPVTHFADERTGMHVAAHEAAHQYQHAGRTHDAGLGPERHAHAVAEAVTGGAPAHRLMGTSGRRVPSAERSYVDYGGGRLGDEGRTLTMGGKEAYAEAGLIMGANSILRSKKSGVTITAGGGGMTVPVPNEKGTMRSLAKVDAKFETDPSPWGYPDFYDDCGRAAREIIGPSGQDVTPTSVIKDARGRAVEAPEGQLLKKDPREIIALALYMQQEMQKIEGFGEMTRKEQAEALKEIRDRYAALSSDEKKELVEKMLTRLTKHPDLARRLGLDEFAEPEVGEAYTIRDVRTSKAEEGDYHWAAVIMVAGGDRVTLESFTTKGQYDLKNESWYFQTYGTGGQSFHKEWAKAMGGEEYAHTTRARTPSKEDDLSALPTRSLIEKYKASTDSDERSSIADVLKGRTINVLVRVTETEDWTGADDVYIAVTNGADTVETGATSLAEGDTGTFSVALGPLAPDPGFLRVNVHEWDVESDDLIVSIPFPPPYLTTTVSTGGGYFVLVSM